MSSDAAAANAKNTDSFVLPQGKILINAELGIDLSSDLVGKPVSLSPDIWYGATPDLTIGLVHSGEGATGLMASSVGTSLCLTGSDNGCAHVYNNVGLEGRYRLMRPLSVDAGLYIGSISDPFQLAVKIGAAGRWNWDKVGLELAPSIFIGLTNRDEAGSGANTEVLYVPATIGYMVAPKVDIAFQAALVLPFTDTSDTYRVPLALGVRFAATPQLGVGLAFSFPALIANNGSADFRQLTLGATYAL
ncbi:MAG TPA: hypothetical protein VGC41_07960 [Kofleriaceae bacterium]